ncbi:MAG TPA: sensor domain-containing diguanylate cyclase [Polyangia bacterium]|nr:sensor domain-containing diguanylate cyclase [Polyangia bacterium]
MAWPRAEAGPAPAAPTLPVGLLALLVDHINVGILTVNVDGTVLQWNRFLHAHTGLAPQDVLGRNLYERCAELPRDWLERKLRSVFLLKNFAFSSWRQRPYLFRFNNHRPLTGGTEPMRQDCTFIPLLHEGEVKAVSIVIIDVTDTFESQTRLDETLATLAAQSERDGLTGIYNRRKLEQVLDMEVQRARRYKQNLSLLMFDIDHFKRINDTHGHLVGDEAIRHVAKKALSTLRLTDFVARYGGEEFVALLPGEDISGASKAAERLREAIAKPFTGAGVSLDVAVSIGVAGLRADMEGGKVLLSEADQALYASKQGGRNRVTVFAAPPATK